MSLISEPPNGVALFIVKANGTGVRQVTPWALRAGGRADWSSDGRRIVFRTIPLDDVGGDIYTIRPDGSGLRRLTHFPPTVRLGELGFSPDEKRIVFSMGPDNSRDMFVMSANGGRIKPVAQTELSENSPDWGREGAQPGGPNRRAPRAFGETMTPMPRTVLIVDDHAGYRAGARALLERDGFEVVGEAADGESAVASARRLRPDVVLLDIQLPGLDGFAVAELLAAAAPSARGRVDLEPRRRRLPAPARRQPGARVHRQSGAVGGMPGLIARLTAEGRMPEALGDLVAGLALLIGGVAIWLGGRRGAANPLMVIAGATWFAGDISGALLYAHRGPLVHVLLSYPERPGAVADDGRRDRRRLRRRVCPGARAIAVGDDCADGRDGVRGGLAASLPNRCVAPTAWPSWARSRSAAR